MRFRILAALIAAALAGSESAQAVPITFGFEVVVSEVKDARHELRSLGPGSRIVGQYTFDSGLLDVDPDPSIGLYRFPFETPSRLGPAVRTFGFAISQIEFDVPGRQFLLLDPSSMIWVTNDVLGGVADIEHRRDGLIVEGVARCSCAALAGFTFELNTMSPLGDPPPSSLASDALLTTPPDLKAFQVREALFLTTLGTIKGELALLVLIPEPTTIALLAIGLVGLAIRQRRRG